MCSFRYSLPHSLSMHANAPKAAFCSGALHPVFPSLCLIQFQCVKMHSFFFRAKRCLIISFILMSLNTVELTLARILVCFVFVCFGFGFGFVSKTEFLCVALNSKRYACFCQCWYQRCEPQLPGWFPVFCHSKQSSQE